ncbi:MAG: hypothetical protein EOO09_11740 [Chitinophagaceae bacterium]|nr:MAG: hypothetical protein EOO09_11740 [Chitinophagaceae bacterium]
MVLASRCLVALALTCLLASPILAQREKTAFQVADGWSEDFDVRSDVAIVYGINDAGGKFRERVKSWRDKGYAVHFMTGIAWGQYQDYFLGKYDGKTHWDEGQVMRNGDTIWHGHNVPYINPSANYLKYMKSHVKEAIDAGVTAIHLEEPEYWARAGYSSSFKNEWKSFYGTEWRPQHESPDATYLSNKLKYQLYYNALKEVFSYVKTYSESKGKRVKCYVPTHSLLNYSSWHIVSPEASLASLPGMDGYIAQIWTGTSREPVHFNGLAKERVFENAFLEYGSMVSMTAPTGRKIFFLTDPIEDRVKTWDDYKRNYQATYTAQLLYPMVADYEVMPWPPRIYRGKYKIEGTDKRQGISPEYATQMQVMVNALNDMPLSKNKVSGSQGVDVLVSNTMMFQNHPTHADYSDPYLANFYGMAMPLLKRGVPVGTVHMENLSNPNALKNTKVLVMSYANMKPHDVMVHDQLSAWVKKGGVLLYYGRDNDAFQQVTEWWNSHGNTFKTASENLFMKLGIGAAPADTVYKVGKGYVYRTTRDPKELVMEIGGDKEFLRLVTEAYANAGAGTLAFKNNFVLQRGPYTVAAVMDEGDPTPLEIRGQVIDLFDPTLPVRTDAKLLPGQQGVFYKIPTGKNHAPGVLAAAARVTGEKKSPSGYSFVVKSPSKTQNIMRLTLPAKPKSVRASGKGNAITITKNEWHEASHTLLLGFENYSDGVDVKIEW